MKETGTNGSRQEKLEKMMVQRQQDYFNEVSKRLRREGFTLGEQKDKYLPVLVFDRKLCQVELGGGINYRALDVREPEMEQAKDRVYDVANSVAEYMAAMEHAPLLKATDLHEPYQILAEYNRTILAGKPGRDGVQFVTWDRDFDGTGVSHGHYYGSNYEGAKEDFAVRSGLVQKERLFDEEQAAEIYRCCMESLASREGLTGREEQHMQEIQEQILRCFPNIGEQHQKLEQENKQEDMQMGGF